MQTVRHIVRVSVLSAIVSLIAGGRTAAGADWPNYRGPNHDGISSETDWQSQWGNTGPAVLWKGSVGTGFSTFAIANGRVYTMGNTSGDNSSDVIFCFDAETGKEVWRHSYPCPLEPKSYEGGTLSTPTVDNGKVYTLSKMGDLFCLDAATGKVVWKKQLNKQMGFELPTWHFSSSPLIAGDMLILNMGSAGLALNKNTGEVVWQNGKGKCGYATPVPFQADGQPCLAIMSEVTLFAVKQADGKPLWQFPWKTEFEINAADPVLIGNRTLITSGYKHGCAMLEFSAAGVKKLWENKAMSMQINCPVVRDGYAYGFDENVFKCVKLDDRKEQWQDRGLGKGSLMMSADGRLIIMSEKGELVIAQADPQKLNVLARSQVLPKTKCWTSPVLANGRIYARNANGDIVCVDVKKRG
jgi:outer membrane protein assembly factor BamB